MLLSRIGPIALEEPLGGAADSNVLRGIHVERNKAMAVKLLPRGLVNRPMGGDTFAEDVKRLQRLVHPGIARVYGGAMDNGQPYLAMELVRGESLRSLLDRRGRLPWEMMVDIADSICLALQYAHENGHVHQRLTPSRVIVDEDGGVKLVGFDCALADTDEVLGLRSPMSVAHYLAPEEFRGKKSSCLATCDLFSLGVILYECLTGDVPWPANSAAELIQARRAGPAPRVSAKVLDCPVWLDVLVARLLEVKRDARLPSADATHRAIVDAKRKVAEGMGAVQHAWSGRQGALATGADSEELRRLRRAQASEPRREDGPFYERAWFLALCLAALVGAGAWFMWPKSEEDLFAAAQPLMESDDPVDWTRAQNQYLDELLERFPDTKYADQIGEFQERFAMHRVMQRMRNFELTGRDPETEIERRFAEAWRTERIIGDHLSAWKKYESLATVFADVADPMEKAYVNVARARARRIRNSPEGSQSSEEVVRNQLNRAQELADANKLLDARRILVSVIELYRDNSELDAIVEQARAQLESLDSQPPAPPSS